MVMEELVILLCSAIQVAELFFFPPVIVSEHS